MSDAYAEITENLRTAYNAAVKVRSERDEYEPDWKKQERRSFLELILSEGRSNLVEIGAGTGVSGAFFADSGLDVVCTDLSDAMAEHCRTRGLTALCQDVLSLDLGRAFQAGFAMNCLLHVPPDDLPAALASIRQVLEPGGLFYLGQYGGTGSLVAGPDVYDPPRYFSTLTDEALLEVTSDAFELISFRALNIGSTPDIHFQSLTLRRPA